MNLKKIIHQRKWGLLVGLFATLIGGAFFSSGLLTRLDHFGLDQHFRHFSTIQADPDIVLIDINDLAVSTQSDWPWPRNRHAALIDILHELSAQTIALDLIFSEPVSPRAEHADLGKHYDVDAQVSTLGDRSQDRIIYDDDELRDAMARAGNVFLPMYSRLSSPDVELSEFFDRGLELIQQNPDLSLQSFRQAFSQSLPLPIESYYCLFLVAAQLESDFSEERSTLEADFHSHPTLKPERIEEVFSSAKQKVAQRKAARFFVNYPNGSWKQFFENTLPDQSFENFSADREMLLLAYRTETASRKIEQFCPIMDSSQKNGLAHTYDWTLPLDKFAEVAKGIGLVAFDRESGEGVLRSVPLLANYRNHIIPQLGFAIACDAMGIDLQSIRIQSGEMIFESESESAPLRFTFNEAGATLLNWHVSKDHGRWQNSFVHIPISRLLEVIENRIAQKENKLRLGLQMAEFLSLRHEDTPAEYEKYTNLINQRLSLQNQLSSDIPQPERHRAILQRIEADSYIHFIEEDAVVWLRRVWKLWQQDQPANENEQKQFDRIRNLYEKFGEGQLAREMMLTNKKFQDRNTVLMKELRPMIENNICLIGYTASAVADLITTPVYSSMPGVMAHANIINMLLQRHPARFAAIWWNMLLIGLTGLIITWIAINRGPVMSAMGLIVLSAIVLIIGCIFFQSATIHLATIPTVVIILWVWASVTVCQQLTQERSRRRFLRALSQYTSSAIASRIAEQTDLHDLEPRTAQVTCFFSDLQGFTLISEKLGPQRTRSVLNPYLETMTRVLTEQGAIVNKFIGDGVFAFFNAPIWTSDDHADAACISSLLAVKAIQEINDQHRKEMENIPLVIRIGLSTGEVFVGDYGSETKLDYTCIGDTVNLASRLERANKVFATTILVNDETREQSSNRFIFRSLGKIQVPGRLQPADIFELAGLRAELSEDETRYITQFEQAIQHFQNGEWETCLKILHHCQTIRSHDQAVTRYSKAADDFRHSPPQQDWDGAISIS